MLRRKEVKKRIMQSFSEISKSEKPDKKAADLVGQKIEIQSISEKTINFKGEDITFYTVVLANGTTVGVNHTIAKQIKEHVDKLPFVATVRSKKSKKGAYYYLE